MNDQIVRNADDLGVLKIVDDDGHAKECNVATRFLSLDTHQWPVSLPRSFLQYLGQVTGRQCLIVALRSGRNVAFNSQIPRQISVIFSISYDGVLIHA